MCDGSSGHRRRIEPAHAPEDTRKGNCSMASQQARTGQSVKAQQFVVGLWGVRYQVKDVQRSIAFYTQMLGFALDQKNVPAFGQVSIGDLKLILGGPGASGSRPMPD